MAQTDRARKVIIVLVAIVCMAFLANEYYPSIGFYNRCIDGFGGLDEFYQKVEKHTSFFATSYERNREDIAEYKANLRFAKTILIFGNLGILATAIILWFLPAPTRKRENRA